MQKRDLLGPHAHRCGCGAIHKADGFQNPYLAGLAQVSAKSTYQLSCGLHMYGECDLLETFIVFIIFHVFHTCVAFLMRKLA